MHRCRIFYQVNKNEKKHNTNKQMKINPLTPNISLVILFLLTDIQFLWCYFGEFGFGSTNNLLIDILLYPHHFYA